jgi:predicted small metal-binding protein
MIIACRSRQRSWNPWFDYTVGTFRRCWFKGCHMPNKVLRCGDVMPGCDKVIEGKTEDEVFAKAEAHARKEHNMTIILPSTMREIGAAIHDKT